MIVLVGLVALVIGGFWLGLRTPARHERSIHHREKEWRE